MSKYLNENGNYSFKPSSGWSHFLLLETDNKSAVLNKQM